jgi:hypothetical protein
MRAIADELRRPVPDVRLTEDLAPSLGRDPLAVAAGVPGAHTEPRDAAAGDERARPVLARPRARVIAVAVAAAAAIAAGWALHARDPRAEVPGLAARGMPSPDAPAAPVAARSTGEDAPGAGSSPSTTRARPRAAAPPNGGEVRSTSPPPTEGKAAASFTVEVRSAPAGAGVIVDGKRVGITPATIALDAPASILVTRAGYRTSRVRVERAGPIDVRLVPARHTRSSRGPAAGETLD